LFKGIDPAIRYGIEIKCPSRKCGKLLKGIDGIIVNPEKPKKKIRMD